MKVSKIFLYTFLFFIAASIATSGETWQSLKKEEQKFREHISAAKIKSIDRTEHTYKFGIPEKK